MACSSSAAADKAWLAVVWCSEKLFVDVAQFSYFSNTLEDVLALPQHVYLGMEALGCLTDVVKDPDIKLNLAAAFVAQILADSSVLYLEELCYLILRHALLFEGDGKVLSDCGKDVINFHFLWV